jgi:hypothetical protein
MSKLISYPQIKWFPLILVMVLILLMSSIPGAQAGPIFRMFTGPVRAWLRGTGYLAFLTRLDWLKVGHVIAFGLLGGVLYRAFNRAGKPGLLLPTTLIFGFACLDEFVQYFVPGRSARLSDVILDTTAALIVMVVMKLVADRWATVR